MTGAFIQDKMSWVSSFIKSDTMMLSSASFLHLKIITGSHSFPKWIARCLGHRCNLKEIVSQRTGRDAERLNWGSFQEPKRLSIAGLCIF